MTLPLPQLVAAGAVVVSVPLLWWAVSGARAGQTVSRSRLGQVDDLRGLTLERPAAERLVGPWAERVAALGRRISPHGFVSSLQRRIDLAGADERWPVERLLALRALLAAAGLLLGGLLFAGGPSSRTLLLWVSFTLIGYLSPALIIDGQAKRRQAEIELGLPDVLDQVTIAVEAGLGFESALAHVVDNSNGPIAEELARALHDMRLGMPRRAALEAMRRRTDVEDLNQFLTALTQAERLGVPIADVLRVQSNEMRTKRRQRAEERAQKLPVKILFPLIFTILPALFIVVIGPAVISIGDAFSGN